MKKTNSDRVFDVLNVAFMLLFTVIILYPLYFTVIASFSEPYDVAKGNVTFWVKGFTLEAYTNVFKNAQIWQGYLNSIIYTAVGTALNLALTIPAAYVLSKKDLPGRTAISWYFLFTMFFSGGLIPSYILIQKLGMLNRFSTLMILGAFGVYNMVIARVYFQTSIPGTLKEYLSIMKTYYDEELISKDFFTMDSTEVQAIAAEKQHVAMSTVAYLVLPEAGDFKEYVATNPLTSDVNSEKVWPVNTRYSIGQFSVSASCEYPEIAVRFGDFFFYDTGCIYKWSGPMEGSDDTLGMVTGWFVEQNDDGSYTFDVRDVRDGRYDNRWVYYVSAIIPSGSICSLGNCTISFFEDQATGYMNNVKFAGIEWKRPLSLDDGDQNFRATQLEYQADYAREGYPGITYFTEEQNARISDLKTVIDSYIETETARFITGVRPLDEFDSYLEELEKLGLSEYLGFYEDYYSQIK